MDQKYQRLEDLPLNSIQKAAVELIKNDLKFLYTIHANQEIVTSSYFVSLMPYMGLVIDGVEDWIKTYNNSSKIKLKAPTFTSEQQEFYEVMRNSIKVYQEGADYLYKLLEEKYNESEEYYSSICNPIIKCIKCYNIYSVFYCNDLPYDNTILDQVFVPFFSFDHPNGEKIRKMAEIAGQYIRIFSFKGSLSIKSNYTFSYKDYGGLRKSPFGNSYNKKFMLFSIMCQINFVLKTIDDFIEEEISTKLRFSYILYYYICSILPDINRLCGTTFTINSKYCLKEFRNAMAHYKLGVVLKESDIKNDYIFGLSQKIFGIEYLELKTSIIKELSLLRDQISLVINN